MSDHVGNPLGDGAQAAMKHATEIITMLMMGLQRLTHIHTRQEQLRLSQLDSQRQTIQGELKVMQARDQLMWEPALRADFQSATISQATEALIAAQPWVNVDPQAARAAHQAEQRLFELDPTLVGSSQRHHAELSPHANTTNSVSHDEEMVSAVARTATAAAWSVGAEQRETAVQESVVSDNTATPNIDEHVIGVHAASAFGPPADTNMAKAVALAGQAFPQPLNLEGVPSAKTTISIPNGATSTFTKANHR